MLFLFFLLALPLARGWQALNTDGDLGRHLRVGRELLADGLFYTDRFSHTMQGQPFVPYEWLSEVLTWLSFAWAGFAGVLVLSGLLVATSVWLLMRWFERMGVDPLLAFVATAAAGLAGSFHWLARPHLWSLVGTVAVLWAALDGRTAGRLGGWKASGGFALLFTVWANVHGGFLYGLVLLALLALGSFLDERLPSNRPAVKPSAVQPSSRPAVQPSRHLALLFTAALLGSSINPVGLSLFSHMFATLGSSWVLSMTLEYRSPNFHLWWGRVFLALLMVVVVALALSRRRVPYRVLVPFVVTTAFALHSARNIPLWALSGFPLIVAHLDVDWRALGGRLVPRVREGFALGAAAARPGAWALVGAVVVMLAAWRGGPLPGFDPVVFPVRVVQEARARGVEGRLFNELAWGGYVLHAWPEQLVLIDAQTDFYGEPLSQEYVAVRSAEPGWEARLDRWGVTLVLLPPEAPLALVLAERTEWRVLARDDAGVLWGREGS